MDARVLSTKGFVISKALFVLMLLLIGTSDLFAQRSGVISGRVLELGTDEPLIGVNVRIADTSIGAVTDNEGYYHILNVQPGTYDVVFSMVGFSTTTVRGVVVHLSETTTINATIGEEAITGEEVYVTAERDVVRMEVSSSRTLITAQSIENSPVANLEEILSSYPGISLTAGSDGTGLVIRGGNLNETNIVIDGLSTRDMRTQQPNTTLNLTAINELEVLSGGFTAEHGGIRSGMVNIVTKEGRLDRYEVVADFRIAPPQKKHFGPSPYGVEGPFWQVHAGPDAMTGVTQDMVNAGQYPFTFIGWNEFASQRLADGNPETDLTPQEALEVWKWQHRNREYANKPDYILDMTLSGPIKILPRTSFMVSQRYEDLQLVYPLSRNNSIASSTLGKITTQLGNGRKLSLNLAHLNKLGVSSGVFNTSIGVVDGTRQGTSYARNAQSWEHLWHDAALNPVEINHFRSGLQYSHALTSNTYYDISTEFTTYQTRQEPSGVRDTTGIMQIGNRWYNEAPFGYVSSEIGRISESYDVLNQFMMSGGGRGRDNSSYWTWATSLNFTSQINRHNQVKAGFDFEYASYKERREVNNEASSHPFEERPQYWTFFDATPINISAYVQNRLEYGDMIANIGIRADYMSYGSEAYNLDPEFIFNELPYTLNNYRDTGVMSFSHLQTGGSVSKLYLSPRIGVSHPITTTSKVFFNYGHFYQPPVLDQLYTVRPLTRGAIIPNLNAAWPRTISYETGFEVGIRQNYLLSFTGYYKDVQNQLSIQNIVSWDQDNDVRTFMNNSYADIRGVEFRFQKVTGKWFQGWVSLEYSTRSTGFTGFRYVFEDPLLARDQRETINQQRQEPRPSISANLTFMTPRDFGPRIGQNHLIGGWRLTVNQSWSDGGQYLTNPDARVGQRRYVDAIDWWNTDLQLTKSFLVGGNVIGFYAQVTNFTNFRGFPNPQNMIQYRESLRFPWYQGERQGNDKWGDWDKDHINLGYHTWNQFINPRHYTFGLRMQL
ncbi:MAG: TonB-dependent receptor [Balneolales bacterium]|nr:TonB-dependent receptor [Balneolales bacterium]